MEKQKNNQTRPSQQQLQSPDTNLLSYFPKSIRSKYELEQSTKDQNILYECIKMLHTHNKIDELVPFFQQIGADIGVWEHKATPQEKYLYLFQMLEKNVQEGLKKINLQPSNYLSLTSANRKIEKRNRNALEKQKSDQFQWLVLNTKNQMLKSKLKTKLVQTINQFKNERKLREVMGKQLQDHQKIHLQDESLDIYQDDKSKMSYSWTKQDEQMFLCNIKSLKQKFTQTEFLKNCHRYNFITNSQLKTLAAQQISRKLDKNNKAFLSRQFLLDKYFSTNQNLTEKQMKFILKTSPLLSKCVDKAFVRSAIKNIQYQDIDKMELEIAEEIIEKFQMIRNLVKNSRKMFKQKLNNRVKKRIQVFEKEKEFQQVRAVMNQKLNLHKTKMLRNMNYRPSSTKSRIVEKRRNYDTTFEDQSKIHQKMIWPVPLNNRHPSTGLFIKDCSEQLNDEFNQYQKNYIKKVLQSQDLPPSKKSTESRAEMINFYTGGPLQSSINRYSYKNTCSSVDMLKKSKIENKNEKIDFNVIQTVCETFKISQYYKELMEKLNSIELVDEEDQDGVFVDKRAFTLNKNSLEFFMGDMSKKTKKLNDDEESLTYSIMNSGNKAITSTQKVIKDKIIEGKQKAKMTVYVKKLLSLAAENSFISLKALNAKFTPSQINSYDSKGNTALFYATKHKNSDFIDYLLGMKADVNSKCSKGTTPLHNAFKTSNYAVICKCLTSAYAPNLNAIDDDGKTPLAYCCRKVLEMLNLQEGVVSVLPGEKIKFNNNSLLTVNGEGKSYDDQLQTKFALKKKVSAKDIR